MKLCDKCGAKNATRAQFCSMCGARFRISDATSSNATDDEALFEPTVKRRMNLKKNEKSATNDEYDVEIEVGSSSYARKKSNERSRNRAVATIEPKSSFFTDEKINEATAFFGASLVNLFVAGGKLLFRLFAPLLGWLFAAIRDSIVRALSSSSEWDPKRPPNFLLWATVQFIVFQLPFAVVGIVYAALANTAREEEAYDVARRRAESAKNWLFFDLAVGIVVAVFKNLVFK